MKKRQSICVPLEIAKCHYPIFSQYSDLYGIMTHVPYTDMDKTLQYVMQIFLTGKWTQYKQIYSISPALGEDLFATSDLNVPLNAIHLPFPCVYIDIAQLRYEFGTSRLNDWERGIVHGYFVWLDEMPDMDGEIVPMCGISVVSSYHSGDLSASSIMFNTSLAEDLNDMIAQLKTTDSSLRIHLKNALLAMAYLSSREPDIVENPTQAAIYRPTNNPLRYASVRKWDVGVRYMQEKSHISADSAVMMAEAGHGNKMRERHSPRAHIRRAHWHTFYVGPGRKERRLLWIPPTLVGIKGKDESEYKSADDLPVVVRQNSIS